MLPHYRRHLQIPLHCEETYQDKFTFLKPKQFYNLSQILHPTAYPSFSAGEASLPHQGSNNFDA